MDDASEVAVAKFEGALSVSTFHVRAQFCGSFVCPFFVNVYLRLLLNE